MGGSDREDYDNNQDYRYGSPTPHRYGPGWSEPRASDEPAEGAAAGADLPRDWQPGPGGADDDESGPPGPDA